MGAVKKLLPIFVLAAGCSNVTGIARVPPKKPPVAVIDPLAGPFDAFVEYVASGASSYDTDGSVVAWHWTVEVKPASSAMTLDPVDVAPTGSHVRFRPDLLGDYRITLVVEDDDGLSSAPATLDFSVANNDGLRVELTWDRDITDVDLHLVSDQETSPGFFEKPSDCYFQNKSPDWGSDGLTDDDPFLPADVDEGFGPEIIGLPKPIAGSYHILSHYYCDDGFGSTTATVRVFVDGTNLLEANTMLVKTGDLWDVARVDFAPDGTATLVVSTNGVVSDPHGCH